MENLTTEYLVIYFIGYVLSTILMIVGILRDRDLTLRSLLVCFLLGLGSWIIFLLSMLVLISMEAVWRGKGFKKIIIKSKIKRNYEQ